MKNPHQVRSAKQETFDAMVWRHLETPVSRRRVMCKINLAMAGGKLSHDAMLRAFIRGALAHHDTVMRLMKQDARYTLEEGVPLYEVWDRRTTRFLEQVKEVA